MSLLFKGVVIVLLFLSNLLGWKRAGKWLDKMIPEDKDQRPVV